MNRVFVDTSAACAVVVSSDANHQHAARSFQKLAARAALLHTTSYVLVETYALLGRRVGLRAVQRFRSDLAPLLDVTWVDEALHERGLDLLIEKGLEELSLVDAVSFLTIRDLEVDQVFAYDRHFEREGFDLLA